MNKLTRILPVTIICALLPASELLGAEAQTGRHSPVVELFFALAPFLILGLCIWYILRKPQNSPLARRAIEHYDRYEQHLQRMEKIAERIAVALEKRD